MLSGGRWIDHVKLATLFFFIELVVQNKGRFLQFKKMAMKYLIVHKDGSVLNRYQLPEDLYVLSPIWLYTAAIIDIPNGLRMGPDSEWKKIYNLQSTCKI